MIVVGVGFFIGFLGVIGFLFMKYFEIVLLLVGIIGYINIFVFIVISIGVIFIVLIGVKMVYNFSEKKLKCLFGIYFVIVFSVMFYKVI